jgi:hypothetical protein
MIQPGEERTSRLSAGDRDRAATRLEIPRQAGRAVDPAATPLPATERAPKAGPNLGWLVVRSILGGLWAAAGALFRGIWRIPRWAKATVLVLAAAGAVAVLFPWDDYDQFGQTVPARSTVDGEEASTTASRTASSEGAASPVPVRPARRSLGDKIRGLFGGREARSPVQISVRFTDVPSEGKTGKSFRIDWEYEIAGGSVSRFFLSLDDGKPFPVSARRPFKIWDAGGDDLPAGQHTVRVWAVSNDGQRSEPDVRAFTITE